MIGTVFVSLSAPPAPLAPRSWVVMVTLAGPEKNGKGVKVNPSSAV